jgi:hypothetical protein
MIPHTVLEAAIPATAGAPQIKARFASDHATPDYRRNDRPYRKARDVYQMIEQDSILRGIDVMTRRLAQSAAKLVLAAALLLATSLT